MNRKFLFLFSGLCILFLGCNNKKDKSYEGDPEAIWFDYQVTAKEGDDNLAVKLQYLAGGKNGKGIFMSKVMLDGELLVADSTKMDGIFYELYKPLAGFTGKHTITVTGLNNDKEYREEFDFRPLGLLTPVADTMHKSELIIKIDGVEQKDHVRILLTDTSFINNGINRVEPIIKGGLVIPQSDLESLENGPVQLELIREYDGPLKSGTKKGGRLQINYSLKREFFLAD